MGNPSPLLVSNTDPTICCFTMIVSGGIYSSRRVCVCVWLSVWVSLQCISLWSLKIKMSKYKHNALLSWNENGEFWIRGFIVKLWHDLLILTVTVSDRESIEVLGSHNKLRTFSPLKVHLQDKINDSPSEILSLGAALTWALCLHAYYILLSLLCT